MRIDGTFFNVVDGYLIFYTEYYEHMFPILRIYEGEIKL